MKTFRWTAYPVRAPVIVGWRGGPAAHRMAQLAPEEIKARAVGSLARVCDVPLRRMRTMVESTWLHGLDNTIPSRGAATAILALEEPRRHAGWVSRLTARCSSPVKPPILRAAPAPSTARSVLAAAPHGRCSSGSEPEDDRRARATEIELGTPERYPHDVEILKRVKVPDVASHPNMFS